MDLIARALIDGKKNEKNEFFYKHAQTIMKAILFWQWKQGRSFMQGMHYLMDGSISDVVKNTLEKVSDKPEYGVVRRLLSPYQNKEGERYGLRTYCVTDINVKKGETYTLYGPIKQSGDTYLSIYSFIYI